MPAAAQDDPPTESGAAGLPESEAVTEAISNAQSSREAWDAARETEAAKESRQRSRSAYANLPDAEALEAIRASYPRLLSQPLWSPPPLAPDEEIKGFTDDLTAEITGPDGAEAIIHSATPIQSSLGSGEPALVDIGLRQSAGGGYGAANPLVPYELPGSLSRSVSFAEGPLGVRFPDARAVDARHVDEKLAYTNAWIDTDLVLSPLPEGFSTTQVLRSPDSPERFAVDLSLPPGAQLRDVGGPDDPAGAVVELAGGGGRLSITSPRASDVDGTPIETELRVMGSDSLEVRIAHREKDLRYPLQLDPYYAFCHVGCGSYWNDWISWTPVYSNWGFFSGNFNGTYGLSIYPTNETTHPEWYGLGEPALWQWQGAFYRSENIYRYISGGLTGDGNNIWAVHGVQDPPSMRWLTGVARVNYTSYDNQSPWVPYGTLGTHTNYNVDHCFIGESPTACSLTALAEHNPDLTGRRPTFQATWVDGAYRGVEAGVFMSYAYAYTVKDWEVPPLPTPPHDTSIDSGPPSQTNSTNATFTFSARSPAGGSALPGTTFECQLDSSTWQQCSSPKSYTGLTDGTHTFQVRAKDIIDQRDPTPASYSWLVDTAPPSGYLASPETYAYGTVTYSGFMQDSGSGPDRWTFEVRPGGSVNWSEPCVGDTTADAASGLYECPWNTTAFGDGEYDIRARMADRVGNTAYTEIWSGIEVANSGEQDEAGAPNYPGVPSDPGLPDTFYEEPVSDDVPDDTPGGYSSEGDVGISCGTDPFSEELIPDYGPPVLGAPAGSPTPEAALIEFLRLPVVPSVPADLLNPVVRTSDYAVYAAIENGERRATIDVVALGDGSWRTTRMEGCAGYLAQYDSPRPLDGRTGTPADGGLDTAEAYLGGL